MSQDLEYEQYTIKEEDSDPDVIEEFVMPESVHDGDENIFFEEVIDDEDTNQESIVEIISDPNENSHSSAETENYQLLNFINNKRQEDVYHCNFCNFNFIGSVEEHINNFHPNKSVFYEDNGEYELLTTDNITENESKNVDLYIDDEPISIKEEYDSGNEFYQIERLEDIEDDVVSNTLDTEFNDKINKDVNIVNTKNQNATKEFSCHLCPLVFPYRRLLTIHMKNHKKEGSSEIASYSSKYYKYVKVKRDCRECGQVFDSRQEQISHMKTEHIVNKKIKVENIETPSSSVRVVICAVCKTVFDSSKNLKLHMRIHNPIKAKTIEEAVGPGGSKIIDRPQFYCEICNKSFDERLIGAHHNMHLNNTDYICGICNRSLENKSSYDLHMKRHSSEVEPSHWKSRLPPRTDPKLKFLCSLCGRGFARPHEKVKHERVHTGEKPHECEVCGKCFRVSYSLTLHLRTHSDLRPYVCSHCHKRFKSYTVYNHHLRTHSDERPYQCPFCPKAFKTGVQLAGHKNGHTKPFSCTECNRPFASLYSVKLHMKTHNKTNKSNQNLKHTCSICGAIYARLFALRSHMKDIHKTEMVANPPPLTVNSSTNEQIAIPNDGLSPSDNIFIEHEISNEALLQEEEVSNFQTEEIVTDWMIK